MRGVTKLGNKWDPFGFAGYNLNSIVEESTSLLSFTPSTPNISHHFYNSWIEIFAPSETKSRDVSDTVEKQPLLSQMLFFFYLFIFLPFVGSKISMHC